MKRKRNVPYAEICQGPNEALRQKHLDAAKDHQTMADFYRLDAKTQRAFVVLVEQMTEDNRQ